MNTTCCIFLAVPSHNMLSSYILILWAKKLFVEFFILPLLLLYTSPHCVIQMGILGAFLQATGTASILQITKREHGSSTLPNTTCSSSNQSEGVWDVIIKNSDLLLSGPKLTMLKILALLCLYTKFSSHKVGSMSNTVIVTK